MFLILVFSVYDALRQTQTQYNAVRHECQEANLKFVFLPNLARFLIVRKDSKKINNTCSQSASIAVIEADWNSISC